MKNEFWEKSLLCKLGFHYNLEIFNKRRIRDWSLKDYLYRVLFLLTVSLILVTEVATLLSLGFLFWEGKVTPLLLCGAILVFLGWVGSRILLYYDMNPTHTSSINSACKNCGAVFVNDYRPAGAKKKEKS